VEVERIPSLVRGLHACFKTGRSRPVAWRRTQLEGLAAFLREREADIIEALQADLGRPAFESLILDIESTAGELRYAQRKLASWMKPRSVSTSLIAQPGQSRIRPEPRGVVLIIGPWNYPLYLVLTPLVGALAAGNCAVVKPSELAGHSAALLAHWLPRYLDPEAVQVVEGGIPETTALLEQRFDHIMYTGSAPVGRIVMRAAAEHLTPVTLELGGKSPCIIDRTTDIEVAVRRIVVGKFLNAGQTCVAPDYILAHAEIHDRLLDRLRKTVLKFYGDDAKRSPHYSRIINERHFDRLAAMLDSGPVVVGGETDRATRYIAPTVLRDVDPTSPVMADEIFGPILPVLKVRDLDEAIAFVNDRPKPLVLFIFSSNGKAQQRVVEQTSSGAVNINTFWLNMAVLDLPFGGVGDSGMGTYHGRHSFDTFSHAKAVLTKPTAVDPSLIYPPYTAKKVKWVRRVY